MTGISQNTKRLFTFHFAILYYINCCYIISKLRTKLKTIAYLIKVKTS